jgi:hypothetical protein
MKASTLHCGSTFGTERAKNRPQALSKPTNRLRILAVWVYSLVLPAIPLAAGEFSLRTDFLTAPNQSNESTNTWQYFYGVNMADRNGTYARLPYYRVTNQSREGLFFEGSWRVSAEDYPPIVGKNTSTNIIQQGVNPGEGVRPGETYMHPDYDGTGVAVGFRAPASGSYEVSGYVRAADTACGDGIRWFLDKITGSNLLASGSVVPSRNNNFMIHNVDLGEGDFLYLTVDAKGNWMCDSTAVDIIVTPSTSTLNIGLYAGVQVAGLTNQSYQLEYIDVASPTTEWRAVTNSSFSSADGVIFDLTSSLAAQRFYRVLVATPTPPALSIALCTGVKVAGLTNHSYRLEYMDVNSPTYEWHTVTTFSWSSADEVILDKTSNLASQRLYRVVEVP